MEKITKRVKFTEAEEQDFLFWASKMSAEKLAALTKLRMSYHGGQRMKKILQKVPYDF